MRIDSTISYPDASPQQAFAIISDPEFRAAVCEATMALEHQVDVEEHDDGSVIVRIHRVMPAEVPDFVRRLTGETIDVVQTETWSAAQTDGGRTADLLLEIDGQPARMNGDIVLESTGAGTTETISGDLKVSIPLIGRKIEAEIAKGLVLAIKVEQKTGREWLSR